jgi:hypothetical protein
MLEETRLAFRGEDPLSRCDDDAYRKLIPIADPLPLVSIRCQPIVSTACRWTPTEILRRSGYS